MSRTNITAYINANARGFHDAMRRLRSDAERTGRSTAQSLALLGSKLRGSAGAVMGAAGLGAGLGAASVGASAVAVRQVARSMAEVGDAAKRAGIDIRTFQELKFVAEQNRVAVDGLVDGMKELQLRADEFIVTGGGAGAEAFERLGYTADELRTKLENPSALFSEIIGKLGQLDRAAQIRVADEIFGGSAGERFVQLIEQGQDGISATIDEAHRLGVIIEDELVEKADELDRKFNALSATVGTSLKTAVVEAAAALSTFLDMFQDIEARTTDTLRTQLNFSQRNLDQAVTRRESLPSFLRAPFDKQIEKSRAEVEQLQSELRDRGMNELRTGLLRQRNLLENPLPPASPGDDKKGSATERADAYERLVEKIWASTTATMAEASALQQTNPLIDDYGFALEKARAAQDLLAAAQQAGKDITPELRAEIDQLATSYAQATADAAELAESQEDIRRKAEEMRDFQKDLSRGIVDGFLEGREAADIFADALSRVSQKLLDMAFDGLFDAPSGGGSGGGLGSLLSGVGKLLFGGTRERGGTVTPGRMYRVNEKGEEFFSPGGPGVIHPAGSSGGGLQITYAPSYNVQGSGPEIDALKAQMAKDKAEFPYRVQRAVAEGRATRAIR
jgi:hypothetical protein